MDFKMFSAESRILFIDDNNAPFILPLIRCFSEYPNVHIDVLVCSTEKPHLFRYSSYIGNIYYNRGEIGDDFETVLRDAIEKSNAQMIIPTRERISQLISDNQSWIEKIVRIHPISDSQTIETVTDKWKLNLWLENYQFPFSRVLPVNKESANGSYGRDFPFPALLKPLKGAGGTGIRLISGKEELEEVLSGNNHFSTGYFLQECIEGFDIDISLFSVEGEILFYTIQRGIMSGSFVFPKGIEFIKNQELFELGSSIIGKLKYSGIAHLDFRYDIAKKEYILVDFNARYWNSLQGSRIMGVNFPVLAAAYTLGLQFDRPGYSTGYFYYGTAIIKRIFRNLTSRTRYPVQLKNSQLYFFIRDPLPEIMYLLSTLLKPFRVIFNRKR